MDKKRKGFGYSVMEKVAGYDVERIPVYSTSGAGRGRQARLSVWKGIKPSAFSGVLVWCVQIGNGKLHPCHDARAHETRGGFVFGAKAQRWEKV